MKKKCAIALPVAGVVIIMAVSLFFAGRNAMNEKSFSEITQGMAKDVASAVCENGSQADKDAIFGVYEECSFQPYHGEKGSTSTLTWRFNDSDGKWLFSLTDLGNRDLVEVSIGGKTRTYKCIHDES